MSMDAAKTVISFLHILAYVQLCLSVTTSAHPSFNPSSSSSGPPVAHDYSRRFAEITRHCQPLLSLSAGELSVDGDRAGLLIRHLSFTDGDWSQDAGRAPLFPFHGSFAGAGKAAGPEAAALASFRLTQVQAQRRGAFNVSGLLTFTETRRDHGVVEFHALFEGVYTETPSLGSDGGGGERVLCMVGNSALPLRSSNSTDLWDMAKNGGAIDIIEPPSAAANILLVLRYPMAHTLTTRAIRGEMTSLSAESDGAYFDKVRLVSRHGPCSRYQFRPADEELEATGSSSSNPSNRDGDGDVAGQLYRGACFCDILDEFTSFDYVLLPLVPNWNCNSTEAFCSRPGPFDAGARAASMAFTRAAVTVQDLRCEPGCGADGTAAAKVSAVFRFVAPWEDEAAAVKRAGLSGATLSAEGAWTASTGRLSMAACLGAGKEAACRHRVALHIPMVFSITRRSIIVGEITAADGSHSPLSFQQRVSARQDWHQFGRAGEAVPMAYRYTKVERAGELLRRRRPSIFRDNFIARSLLSYPVIDGAADDLVSLSNLAADIGYLGFQSVPPKLPFVPNWIQEEPFNIEFDILSVGTLVGSYSPPFEDRSGMPVEQIDRVHGMGKHHVVNVSAELTAIRMYLSPVPVMSVEGVYNPEDGRMHLIGCRRVHAPWRVLSKSRDLEDGMDCSIEVTVEYPPTTMRWLVNPVAKVSVASTREDDDPLHFATTELRSMPFLYRDLRGVLTETTLENLLCVAMLTITAAAAVGQLRHVSSHAEVAPYVSLAMLGVQALGYVATLVTNTKMLPAWPRQSYMLYADPLECAVRALTLAALLLTAWLAHKVWSSRVRARARSPLEPGRVPGDGAVLLCSLAVYLGGLVIVLVVHQLSTHGASATATPPPPRGNHAEAEVMPSSNMCSWADVAERYVGAVKEWFLLPQVVGNALWCVNCKPLAARYYAGVTAAWLLPHVYGYLRPPVPGALYYYSAAGAVAVPGVGVALALLVFVQQRWNYKIVGWATRTQRNKLPKHVS
ncbi:hypothetical protein SETIT_1G018400v2 [Setaria italica]|nr:uncharacterized protein LOC101763161 [Setaria italica]RCV04660.1 hypothetical protein SETIT_1G018400v2 [Setaria italica]